MARPAYPWFRASKDGWYVTINGRKVSLGVRGRENERAALDAWHKLMAGAGGEPAAAGATVAGVVKAFLADAESRVRPATVRFHRDRLLPFSRHYGHLPVSELTEPMVEAFVRKPGWSASTRRGTLTSITAALNWAVRARMIDRNPVPHLRRPPAVSRGAESVITAEEHARLLEAASPYFRSFLIVLHATGARPGEVASITAENFDADAGLVRLAQHKTAGKTGKSRTILLPPAAAEVLREQRERYPTGPLLRNQYRRPWTDWAITRAMALARKKAGIGRAVTAYGYRHTFATDALAAGVPDAIVAEMLGHRGTTMIHKHYAHLSGRTRELREALSRVRS